MTLEEAMKYFASPYELAKKLRISHSNVYRWLEQNFIPIRQQHKINDVTGANLPIDLDKKSMEERIKNGSIDS